MSDVVDLEHRIELLRKAWLSRVATRKRSNASPPWPSRVPSLPVPRSRAKARRLEFFVAVEGDAVASVGGRRDRRIVAAGSSARWRSSTGESASPRSPTTDMSSSCSDVTSSTRCSRSRCRRSHRSCSPSSAPGCARSIVTPESTHPRAVVARRGPRRVFATGRPETVRRGAHSPESPRRIAAPTPNTTRRPRGA